MPSVLIVDDELGLAEMVAELLVMAGHAVEIAINGKLGLASIHQARPDIILLDVMMPIMSGIEMLHALKEDTTTRDIPVVMMSAADANRLGPTEREMIVGFLQKPFTFDDLTKALRRGFGVPAS